MRVTAPFRRWAPLLMAPLAALAAPARPARAADFEVAADASMQGYEVSSPPGGTSP